MWPLATQKDGYGTFRGRMAHRAVYEGVRGAIPEGTELDHLCVNPVCVNPWHMEPVTRAENIRRSAVGRANREKTSCPQGHPYSGTNANGARICHICQAAAQRKYRQ